MLTTHLPVVPKLKITGATPALILYSSTALVGTNLPFKLLRLIYSFLLRHVYFFYVLLTVHLSIILVIDQLNAQILVL